MRQNDTVNRPPFAASIHTALLLPFIILFGLVASLIVGKHSQKFIPPSTISVAEHSIKITNDGKSLPTRIAEGLGRSTDRTALYGLLSGKNPK